MGLFKLIESVADLVVDTSKVVTEPTRMIVDTADALVKPLADGLEEIADEFSGKDHD